MRPPSLRLRLERRWKNITPTRSGGCPTSAFWFAYLARSRRACPKAKRSRPRKRSRRACRSDRRGRSEMARGNEPRRSSAACWFLAARAREKAPMRRGLPRPTGPSGSIWRPRRREMRKWRRASPAIGPTGAKAGRRWRSRSRSPPPSWRMRRPGRVVVVDCLTLWLSNLMLAGRDPGPAVTALADAIGALAGPAILVSNEVGHGYCAGPQARPRVSRLAGPGEPGNRRRL